MADSGQPQCIGYEIASLREFGQGWELCLSHFQQNLRCLRKLLWKPECCEVKKDCEFSCGNESNASPSFKQRPQRYEEGSVAVFKMSGNWSPPVFRAWLIWAQSSVPSLGNSLKNSERQFLYLPCRVIKRTQWQALVCRNELPGSLVIEGLVLTEDQSLAFSPRVRRLTTVTPAPGDLSALFWHPRASTHMWVGKHTPHTHTHHQISK